MDVVITTLDNAWGPRRLKGWCEAFAQRFCAPGALASEEAAKYLSNRSQIQDIELSAVPNLLNARPPPTLLVLMGCKHARCATRFCRYLKDADEARHEATLKRRIAEAEAAPSPTRAGRKANPGQGSPGSGINAPPAHAANTTRVTGHPIYVPAPAIQCTVTRTHVSPAPYGTHCRGLGPVQWQWFTLNHLLTWQV